jgi:FkbH-like protein
MYETEITTKTAALQELPANIIGDFSGSRPNITHRSLISWAEHCTECTMPSCFSTCDYYSPRDDLKCRRFEEGIVGIELPEGIVSHLMKITFRMWGKLEGKGTTILHSTDQARKHEQKDFNLSTLQHKLPLPYNLEILAGRLRSKLKSPKSPSDPDTQSQNPNCFILEIYNPDQGIVSISLTLRPTAVEKRTQFQKFIELSPGYNFIQVGIEEITGFINLSEEFLIQIQPQPDTPGLTLYFGMVDFAIDQNLVASEKVSTPSEAVQKAAPKVKCVVWDLDNTMWKGTLIEDGENGLVLNEDAVKLVKELDQRGILNSIASKNNADDALAILAKHGLDEYFLYPDISWEPKSLAIKRIASRLNIGIDTFAFIDDQPFERAEVSETHSSVRCFDVTEIDTILTQPGFDVPVTDDGKKRRHMYKNQIEREEALDSTEGDYEKFLVSCNLSLSSEKLSEETLPRVYELAQRTNQMNFTGNRYSRKALQDVIDNPDLDTYVLGCKDRFGDYGIIGFSIIRKSDATLQDLMFSCRIQSKRVDHAFLTHVINTYHKPGKTPFQVEYRKSSKNTPSAQIFSEMGFIETGKKDDISILSYPEALPLPTNNIVEVKVA